MTTMTQEERALWDARAEVEIREQALEALRPMCEVASHFGNEALEEAMDSAGAHLEAGLRGAREKLERLAASLEAQPGEAGASEERG